MPLHLLRITLITILLLACIFLPFIPGDYDASAITLSTIAQLVSLAGLLFIPMGLAWLIYELRKRRAGKTSIKGYHFALAALVISGIVVLAAVVGALASNNRFPAIGILLGGGYFIFRTVRKLRRNKNSAARNFNFTPVYLVCIPLIAVLSRQLYIESATEYSRDYVIRQSAGLIRDIEAYRQRTGHYPTSLHSLWEDYKPSITGIQRYHYEPYGKAYNLYFEQLSYQAGTREIVMYNKFDEHQFTSHNQDLLRLSPSELDRQRGYFAVHQLEARHWKYFWFD
ncbi:hypothetical protein GZH53_05500 [Flavihumibacter sp. R14]|nr:hypothetical protein [Flavihumibacter soli]